MTSEEFETEWEYVKPIKVRGITHALWSCKHKKGYTAYRFTHSKTSLPKGPGHYTSYEALENTIGKQE
jgi:hypothetical protein